MREGRSIAIVTEGIDPIFARMQPWFVYREELAKLGFEMQFFDGGHAAFEKPFDAMLIHAWQHWENPERFQVDRILPLLERQIAYRSRFPDSIQIVVNHTDMARRPWATPYWRPGDPVLYRTPAYNRRELFPFPPNSIWPFEMVWGRPAFLSSEKPRYRAGFIGQPSGPPGYRQRVAKAVSKVGISSCKWGYTYRQEKYDAVMSECAIIVCPQGWGENSVRHWDAWFSGKVVLTDEACHSVEMIPGIRLKENIHYLIYRNPEEIPDIVSEWTRPGRRGDLAAVAENGRMAALSYDPLDNFVRFLKRAFEAKANRLSLDYPRETSLLFSDVTP